VADLRVTFGPVQEFVAQARRTRDLWAGSLLLSHLANKAIDKAEEEGARIITPYRASARHGLTELHADERPSAPNHFWAEVDDGNAARVAGAAVDAWNEEWRRICDRVWQFLASFGQAAADPTVREIFCRQVKQLWYAHWAVGDDSELTGRKEMRAMPPADAEPGEKCTMCGVREALTPRRLEECPRYSDYRAGVRLFWSNLACKLNKRHPLELRKEGERLCGVCTVKRLFPRAIDDGPSISPESFPSTSTMATLSWRNAVLKKLDEARDLAKALKCYFEVIERYTQHEALRVVRGFERLEASAQDVADEACGQKLIDYDGDVFFREAIVREGELPWKKGVDINKAQGEALKTFDRVRKRSRECGAGEPSPFYALLVMDGDRMGELFSSNRGNEREVSGRIGAFAGKVRSLIESGGAQDPYNGRVVYAGGDDLMALLPMDGALAAARDARNLFLDLLKEYVQYERRCGTISAALVYAHYTTPLKVVVRRARELLEKKAKDQAGRDAFTVEVWKRGGPILSFARNWKDEIGGTRVLVVDELNNLARRIAEKEISGSFLHRLRDLLEMLHHLERERKFDRDKGVKLLAAEYMKTRRDADRKVDSEEALRRVERLYDLCRPSASSEDKPLAPALFARFLAQKEV